MINQENLQNTEEAKIVNDEFSPLDSPVKQRAYTQTQIDENQNYAELEEPNFVRPTFSDFEDAPEEQEPEPERPFNQAYSELDGKEKAMGAEMMAEMTLDIYEKGCHYMGKIPEISEAKIDRLIAEGEIDPSIQLQTEAGAMPIKEFAVEFNDSIKDAFSVTDEFKEKVKPPLVRVFKKRGIGMTDEQLLAYYFITDFGAKGAQVFMLHKTANSIIDSLKENTMAIRESKTPRQASPQQYQERPTSTDYTQNVSDNVSYTENIAEVVKEPIIKETSSKKRSVPRTNIEEQVSYFEPEEKSSVYNNLQDREGFTDNFQDVAGMPKFGDPAILSELERLSKNNHEKPVRKAKRTTAVRKPRAKK